MKKLSISNGNSKMGQIPSVSLPPIKTCTNCKHCAKDCYAAKLCRIYPSVKNAYENNLKILLSDPDDYFMQVKYVSMFTRFFRWHVSGDIVNREYFDNMVKIAVELPGTQFLAFTKNYTVVNDWISENGNLPDNLKIIFSGWYDLLTPDNPYNLPCSNVINKGETVPDNYLICGGNCSECACRGVGCWQIKNGETIAFYKH